MHKTENPLRDLITRRVRETGLDEAVIPPVVNVLEKHANFLGVRADPDASLFDYRRKLTEVAEAFRHLGVTYEAYRDAAARKPNLFYLSSDTVIGNIRGTVVGLQQWGLTEKDYVTVWLEQHPQLGYLPPAIPVGRVTEVVASTRHLGMTEERFIAAARRRGQLFYQSVRTTLDHIHTIFRMQARGIIAPKADLLTYLLRSPDKLTLSQNNLQLRVVYAQAKKIADASPTRILARRRRDIEPALVAHYGFDPAQKQIPAPGAMAYDGAAQRRGHRAVLSFIQRGLLTEYKVAPAVSG